MYSKALENNTKECYQDMLQSIIHQVVLHDVPTLALVRVTLHKSLLAFYSLYFSYTVQLNSDVMLLNPGVIIVKIWLRRPQATIATTGNHSDYRQPKQPQATIATTDNHSNHRQPQQPQATKATTGSHRQPQAATGNHRLYYID